MSGLHVICSHRNACWVLAKNLAVTYPPHEKKQIYLSVESSHKMQKLMKPIHRQTYVTNKLSQTSLPQKTSLTLHRIN